MAQTTEPYTGNGTRGSAGNALSFTFPYLKLTDVKVSLNGTTLATTKYTFPTATTLQFNTGSETTLQATSGAPKTGVSILIYRDTDVDSARHVFGQGSAFKSQDLNENKDQSLYFDQEVGDTANPKNFVTSAQISDGTSLSAADKTKLDTIETSAKDDQTGAEIKTLYEGESNTNAFTDAEKTKLGTVEANAKDDQTAAEIKSLYESNSQTNAFTDAEKTKLQGVEDNAKDDQTASEIKSLYESNSDTNAFTDNDHTKLDGIEDNAINASNAAITNKLPLAGGTMTGDLTLSSTSPYIKFIDTFDNNSDYKIAVYSGQFRVEDTTNNQLRFRIASDGTVTVAQDLAVFGNLSVNGTSTTIDTTTLTVEDKNIELGKVSTPSDTTADGGGITLKGATDKTFNWINSTDSWTSSEHIALPDDKKILLGASQDLEIFHGGSGNYPNLNVIKTTNTNTLLIETAQGGIAINNRTGSGATNFENMVTITPNGAVNAYYDGVKKFETRSGGVTVSGSVNAAGGTFSSNLRFADNVGTLFGASDELQVFHSSGTSYISHNGSGQLQLRAKSGEHGIKIIPDGAVELYYDNSKKLETTSTGTLTTGFADHRQDSTSAYSSTAVPSNVIARFYNESPTNNSHASITLGSRNGSGSPDKWYITCASQTGSYDADLAFSTRKSSTDISEVLRFTNDGHLQIPADNAKLQIGASQDFEIFHDGTQNILRGNTPTIFRNLAGTETTLKLEPNGAVKLYYDTVKKLETTSTGATVTGVLVSDGIDLGDDERLRFGVSQDLQIYHNGSNSWIYENGTGNLNIGTNNSNIQLRGGTGANETFISCETNGAVELYYDHNKKLETTSIGVNVGTGGDLTSHLGNCNRLAILGDSTNPALLHIRGGSPSLFFDKSGATDHGKIYQDGQDLSFYSNTPANPLTEAFVIKSTSDIQIPNDDKKLQIGASQDLELYHDGTNSIINNATGILRVRSNHLLLSQTNNSRYLQGNSGVVELFYDNSKKLETTSTGVSVTGQSHTSGAIVAKAASYSAPSSGTGLEIYYATGVLADTPTAYIISYDRDNSAYKKINYDASEHKFRSSGTEKFVINSAGATVTTTSATNSIKNITTSTSAPSGGSDGDLWFTYVS